MPEIDSTELLKNIRKGEFSPVYYIYGKDVMTVENAAKAIFKKCLGKDWRNSVERLEGKELDVSDLADKIELCPMFAERNCIMVNDLNCEELTADKLKILIDAVDNIPDSTLLVINITGFDVKNGKKTFTAKNKKLVDCIKKRGTVCECGVKSMAVLSKWVCDTAKAAGGEISKANAQKLCEYCLMDSMLVGSELKKLCDYRDGEEITSRDIDLLVTGQIETDSFKLARAVVSLDAELSFKLLEDLLNKRNEPVAVLSAIAMSFTDLYRARIAIASGRQTGDVSADFNYKGRDFVIRNAFRDCRRISKESMRKCMSILKNTDRQLKQSGMQPRIVLEKAVTEMLMAAREK